MPDKRVKTPLAAVLCVLLFGCAEDSPEARIEAAIGSMEAAIEARDSRGFLAHVADDFAGQGGAVDRTALRGYLASLLVGNESVSVTLAPAQVRLHGDARATVEVSALVLGGTRLPERGEHLEIRSGWRLEDGEWKVYSADWA